VSGIQTNASGETGADNVDSFQSLILAITIFLKTCNGLLSLSSFMRVIGIYVHMLLG